MEMMMKKVISAREIHTMSQDSPTFKHLIVEDGFIVDVLNELPERYQDYEHIQFTDGFIYPSFNDTHMHLIGYGASLSECQLEQTYSIEQLKARLAQYISRLDTPIASEIGDVVDGVDTTVDADIITGRGWNHDDFVEGRLPNRYDLDSVCSDRPVILRRACGHIAVVNTAALERFNIKSNTTVEGGEVCSENGIPTGILKENAIMLIQKPLTMADIKKHILTAQAKLNAYGITSVQTDDLIMVTQDKHSDLIHLFEEMAESQALTVRVYLQAQFFSIDNFKRQVEGGYRQNAGNFLYKNGPLKILADGSLGARTAMLRAPYHDDASAEGIFIHTEDELRALMAYAFENQIDVAIHGIGDYTIQFAIDTLGALQRQYPRDNARNAIIHCQIMDDALIQAMAKSNIDALVQPVFLEYDMTIVESRVGKALAKSSYAYKTMLESGIKLGFGSDAPVEDPNPFRSLYYATSRTRPDGKSFFVDECITLNQALAAFTSEAAYFSHEEHIKGKLEKGFLADFIVVSKPLDSLSPNELLEMDIKATYLGGTCVYQNI
jgi:hypothetical protein